MQNYYQATAAARKARAAPSGKQYETGNRTAIITVSSTIGVGGTISKFVNGDTTETGQYFSADSTPSGKYLRFQLLNGAAIFTGATYYQSDASWHANMKWQGSNNGTDWTDIGSTFRIGGTTPGSLTQLSGNSTAYTYYQMIVTDNTYSMKASPWVQEFEFTSA